MNTFVEPASHAEARKILGKDFHGLDAAIRRFGDMSDDGIAERCTLRLRNHRTGAFCSEEQTLRILEECKGTHFLVATHETVETLPSLHVHRPEYFWGYEDPWFGMYQGEYWAIARITEPWLLIRKDVVPGSTGIPAEEQPKQLQRDFPKERMLLPSEFGYGAILHCLETNEWMCGQYIVRFHAQTAEGHWVRVKWHGDRLFFSHWHGRAYGGIASGSVRTS